MLTEGTLLQGRYRIIQVLGGGGMGQVYLAHDVRLADRPCAVKELLPDPHASPQEQEEAAGHFRREAAILAHLGHPNLPNVYDHFEEENRFYLVMDCVEGETLAYRLGQSPQGLSEETVLEWAVQLCDVLEYLHSQTPPVIFRDLKPGNVMVTPEGDVKLIDFGVARLFDPGKRTDTLKMGTAGYAPPEQYAGQGQTTPRSDIYSLGVTLHELLTGDDPTAHPFVFTPPRELNPGVSPSLSSVVMQALCLDPEGRFPSIVIMKEALLKATRPRRLRLPSIQRRHGTGTAVMPAIAAVSARRGRTRRLAVGVARWLAGVVLTIVVALSVVAVALLLVGAFALSAVAERAIAGSEWGLIEGGATRFVVSEPQLRDGLLAFLEPYALGVVDDVQVDFHPPDTVELSLVVRSWPARLESRVVERDGVPIVTIERLNGVPLYLIGGIVSNGINRGFAVGWSQASVQIATMTIGNSQLFVTMERVGGAASRPSPTSTPDHALVRIRNETGQVVAVDIGGVARVNLAAYTDREISLPAGTYTYTIVVGSIEGARGEITWELGRNAWVIR